MNLWQFEFLFYKDGKFNYFRLLTVFGILFLLIFARSSVGVLDEKHILSRLKTEIISDYKIALYKKYGILDSPPGTVLKPDFGNSESRPWEELEDLKVELDNISMSASIFKWGLRTDVVVRYDFVLTSKGVLQQQQNNVYKSIDWEGNSPIRDSNKFIYYMQYILG